MQRQNERFSQSCINIETNDCYCSTHEKALVKAKEKLEKLDKENILTVMHVSRYQVDFGKVYNLFITSNSKIETDKVLIVNRENGNLSLYKKQDIINYLEKVESREPEEKPEPLPIEQAVRILPNNLHSFIEQTQKKQNVKAKVSTLKLSFTEDMHSHSINNSDNSDSSRRNADSGRRPNNAAEELPTPPNTPGRKTNG